MPQTDVVRSFQKVSDTPCRIRCQTQQALVDAVSERDSMYTRNAAEARGSGQLSPGVRYNVLDTNGLPFRGQQEIRFFDANFGLIISDFTFIHDFDYEFVYEHLGFIQFRTGSALMRRVGGRGPSVSSQQPSFKVSVAPSGHVDEIQYVGGSRWQTVTPFFDTVAIERLFDYDREAVRAAGALLRGWKQQFGTGSCALSTAMLDALRAIQTCSYTGALRRAFFEAKTTELICLSVGIAAQHHATGKEARLTPRVRSRLEQARDILDADSVNSPTLAELARRVGINRRMLASGFRQLFNQSVYQYTLGNRMSAAKAQLMSGCATIAQIAISAGYSDQATFSRAFRRVFGHPPSHYRRARD